MQTKAAVEQRMSAIQRLGNSGIKGRFMNADKGGLGTENVGLSKIT